MKLYSRKSGLELKPGDAVETFRGVIGKLQYGVPPHKRSSTGRVSVKLSDGWIAEYFPSVINAVWLETPFQLFAIHMERDDSKVVLGVFHNLASITDWLLTDPDEYPQGYDAYARDLRTEELYWLDGEDDEWKTVTPAERAAWPTLIVKVEDE